MTILFLLEGLAFSCVATTRNQGGLQRGSNLAKPTHKGPQPQRKIGHWDQKWDTLWVMCPWKETPVPRCYGTVVTATPAVDDSVFPMVPSQFEWLRFKGLAQWTFSGRIQTGELTVARLQQVDSDEMLRRSYPVVKCDITFATPLTPPARYLCYLIIHACIS